MFEYTNYLGEKYYLQALTGPVPLVYKLEAPIHCFLNALSDKGILVINQKCIHQR